MVRERTFRDSLDWVLRQLGGDWAERRLATRIRRAVDRGEPLELDRRSTRQLIDRIARRELGMTGEDFLAAVAQDAIPDSPVAEHLAILAGAQSRFPSAR